MRKILVLAVCALAAVPAAGLAQTPSGNVPTVAPRICRALQAQMGSQAFRQAFGNLGGCVSRLERVDQLNRQSAEELCRAEQSDLTFPASHGGKTFSEFYGRNANRSDAFGNCVSTKARSSVAAIQQATPNPAQTCRALRTSMGASTFALTFGTNANHSNAFGKCVSRVARTGTANIVNAADACSAELADVTFAATHGGKTFAQFYGTNPNLHNAFGKCVSQKARAAAAQQQQALVRAAKACQAERRSDPAAFRSKYGSRPNAFGKCVSQKAQQR